MSGGKRPRGGYKTTNWAAYNAVLKARGSLRCGWTPTCSGALRPPASVAANRLSPMRPSSPAWEWSKAYWAWPLCIGGCRTSALSAAARSAWVSNYPTVPVAAHWACWSTALASSFWVKASGSARSTVPSTNSNGARCIRVRRPANPRMRM